MIYTHDATERWRKFRNPLEELDIQQPCTTDKAPVHQMYASKNQSEKTEPSHNEDLSCVFRESAIASNNDSDTNLKNESKSEDICEMKQLSENSKYLAYATEWEKNNL